MRRQRLQICIENCIIASRKTTASTPSTAAAVFCNHSQDAGTLPRQLRQTLQSAPFQKQPAHQYHKKRHRGTSVPQEETKSTGSTWRTRSIVCINGSLKLGLQTVPRGSYIKESSYARKTVGVVKVLRQSKRRDHRRGNSPRATTVKHGHP